VHNASTSQRCLGLKRFCGVETTDYWSMKLN